MIEVKTRVENKYTLSSKDVSFTFLPTGDILQALGKEFMLNQVIGNTIDGSMNNLFLRVHSEKEGLKYAPLLGINSKSQFSVGENSVKWEGIFEGISYTVQFTLG